MGEPTGTQTSRSLLERLRIGADEQDWQQFVDRYSGLIFRWARQRGLDAADAQDATQEVLVRMVSALKRFHYDPAQGSFRGWLRTTTAFAIGDVIRKRDRPGRGTGNPSVDDELARLADTANLEETLIQQLLVEEAEARVLRTANAWHVQAYGMWKAGHSRGEIAEGLHQQRGAVNVAIHRLAHEVRRTLGELEAS